MNLVAYLRDNLTGGWQVMLGRSAGLGRLDTSIEGFWRSFAAGLLLIPFSVLSILSQHLFYRNDSLPDSLTGGSNVLYAFPLLLDWIAFPLAFALLAPTFGLAARYVPFIVARNWSSIVFAPFAVVVDILHLIGVLPSPALPLAALIATAIGLWFSYVVARTALAVSVAMAAPIVLLDFLISTIIWLAFDRLT